MAIFELQGPDGAMYEVDAPDVSRAVAAFKKMNGAGSPAYSDQPASIAERSDITGATPQNADALRTGLINAGAEKTAPATSSFYKMAMDFLNQGSAAGQRTSPHIDAQKQNILSTEVHENDAGELLFVDPQSGNLVKTDSNKHVALRDPADGKIKVYARTEVTDESIPSSLGRIVGTGLASGSPVSAPVSAAVQSTVRPMQEVGQAIERLNEAGYKVQIPRVVSSDNLAAQNIGAQLRNIPVVGNPIVQKTEQAVGQLGNVIGDIATTQGAASMERAGELASKGIKDWVTVKSKALVKKAYDAVDEAIDPNVYTKLSSTQSKVADIAARRQNAMITGDSKAINEVIDAVQSPNGLNYAGIKDLRSNIGEMLDKPHLLPAGMKQSELKQIYGALTEDLKRATEAAGGKRGLALWQRANSVNTAVQNRREQLAKVVGMDSNATPAQVFDRLKAAASSKSRADTALLLQARKVIGDDWDEVVSGVTGQLGKNAKGDFSPAIFANHWEALSPSGKAALYQSSAHRQALDDVAKISKRMAVDLQKFANPSGTGQTTWASLGGAAIFAEPLTALSIGVGGNVLARILASPASASSLSKWAKIYERAVAKPGIDVRSDPAALSGLMIASRNLANTVNNNLGTTLSPADFLKSLQGPMSGRAEDEQP